MSPRAVVHTIAEPRTALLWVAAIGLSLAACGGGQAPDDAAAPAADVTATDASPAPAAAEETPPPAPDDPFARSTSPDAVIEVLWQWVGTETAAETVAVAEPERYLLLLNAAGRAEVEFDCNSGGGEYTIDEGTLVFGPLISTRMACPDDSQDYVFMSQLQRVASFYVEGGELHLGLAMDGGTMRFAPVAESE